MFATPAPISAQIGSSHGRPIAGHVFAGFTVTPDQAKVESVDCDATLHGKTLPGHVRRYYQVDGGPVIAITCGWMIPARTHGTLTARVAVTTSEENILGPVVRWRVKR